MLQMLHDVREISMYLHLSVGENIPDPSIYPIPHKNEWALFWANTYPPPHFGGNSFSTFGLFILWQTNQSSQKNTSLAEVKQTLGETMTDTIPIHIFFNKYRQMKEMSIAKAAHWNPQIFNM